MVAVVCRSLNGLCPTVWDCFLVVCCLVCPDGEKKKLRRMEWMRRMSLLRLFCLVVCGIDRC